ncbi:MAG: Ldh family oxidoreductase [Rhodospirillales bacterium]|nr:Ldh family oxidoreductase [Rhodospirillales bacterium]
MDAKPTNADVKLTLDEVRDLTFRALTASKTNEANARSVTESVVDSEAEGIHSHGLARLPTYCENARHGKVDGHASPTCAQIAPAALRADARDGFAHPAIDLGLPKLLDLAGKTGIAALAVTNSYNAGVVGYHVRRIAKAGLVGLGFVNSPASIAPWGGTRPVFGTNPIACGIPRKTGEPIVIDQSSSVIAKSEVNVHFQRGEPIPLGWAFDKDGKPTTDPKAALEGSMAPAGGYKGAGMALLVEIMAAAVTGATLSFKAHPYTDNATPPSRTGQMFIAVSPAVLSGPSFADRIEELIQAMTAQEGVRLPGSRRLAARERTARDGVTIRKALHDRLVAFCRP